MKLCPRCTQSNTDEAKYCHDCGADLQAAPPVSGTIAAQGPVLTMTREERLWREFIGPQADYYLRQFKKFSSPTGQPKFALSWNWPAFLFISFLWFLYRKMYLHAAVYAVGPMLSTYLTGDLTVGIVWSVMAGAMANYLYYWHCKEHIGEIQKQRMNPAGQEAAIKEAGGVQPYVIWVGVVLYAIFLATLVKMVEEGPPGSEKTPAKPASRIET